jgi:hypothetical protein
LKNTLKNHFFTKNNNSNITMPELNYAKWLQDQGHTMPSHSLSRNTKAGHPRLTLNQRKFALSIVEHFSSTFKEYWVELGHHLKSEFCLPDAINPTYLRNQLKSLKASMSKPSKKKKV